MDLYPWIVIAHVFFVIVAFGAHGASAFAVFRVRATSDRAELRTLLDLSQTSLIAAGIALLLAILLGIWAELVDRFEPRGGPDEDEAMLEADEVAFGPPVLAPLSMRDGYGFEQHVGMMWRRRGGEIPEAWYRLPIFYFSNMSELRGPDDPVWAPAGSEELDFEIEIAALIDTPARDLPPDRGEEAIGGYTIFNDWSARDLQRDETTVRLGPHKGKDFAASLGPWLVPPTDLGGAPKGHGFD